MPIDETRIVIPVPYELKEKLDREARKKRTTRAGLVRLIFSDWLEEYGEKKRGRKSKKVEL